MADSVLVVTTGLTLITTALVDLAAVAPKWVQWGVGTTGPVTGNTDLEDKTGATEDRENDTCTVETATVAGLTDDTFRVTALITCNATGKAITEVGTFNADDSSAPPTGDTMFLRATFSAINLVEGNSIDFTIDTKFVPV